MALTREEVKKVALLARLELMDEEIDTQASNLNALLEQFEKLLALGRDRNRADFPRDPDGERAARRRDAPVAVAGRGSCQCAGSVGRVLCGAACAGRSVTMPELYQLNAQEAAQKIASGEISAVELTKSVLARIDAVEPNVRAFLTVTPELALAQAENVDSKRTAGEAPGPLAGVPMALKDNLCTTGIKTTAGSKILHNFIPPYNATVAYRDCMTQELFSLGRPI